MVHPDKASHKNVGQTGEGFPQPVSQAAQDDVI